MALFSVVIGLGVVVHTREQFNSQVAHITTIPIADRQYMLVYILNIYVIDAICYHNLSTEALS